MIVIDTSVIIAVMDEADSAHGAVSEWLDDQFDDLVTTPLIAAEIDHLVTARGGSSAAAAFHADLLAGAYLLEWWREAIHVTVRVARRYADAALGLADASLVALADHLHTTDIATLDHRHFRAVRPLSGAPAFRLLPADA